ncbi:Lysophospholipid acyltransferase LPEAT1 [Symbiodinium microadriaticum]|uniref:Lysophospholipid acyltransferase LPEAT1 n=1 Tax=Symbiodinium microadriaticum TaxID=2951 RepID=A0A1Q9DCS6_SYMMI|nr:Lysophospholipid acyltransferase LPEAT1 [Symbiodinium microadriaticum]
MLTKDEFIEVLSWKMLEPGGEAIANHATEWQRGERPLLIWPEGTTSNGQGIKDFKHGAFLPGVPVRPVLIKYTGDWDPSNVSFRDAKGEMKPAEAYGDRQWVEQFLGHMLHSCTVLICKPYTPSEEEQANPELFKANVHKLMSECRASKLGRSISAVGAASSVGEVRRSTDSHSLATEADNSSSTEVRRIHRLTGHPEDLSLVLRP